MIGNLLAILRGPAAPSIDLCARTDAELAALGLNRDDLRARARRRGWNPPDYWLRQPETACAAGAT